MIVSWRGISLLSPATEGTASVVGQSGLEEESKMSELVCIECSSLLAGGENLRPVISTDGKEYAVACIHKLPQLRKWRLLTDEEHKEWEKSSKELVDALWGE